MITVPADFAAGITTLAGPTGYAWIERLPQLIDTLCREWNLSIDGPPMHGYLGLVVPVTQQGAACVLKVSWLNESNAHELMALQLWNGQGAVQVLAADPERGAMLLERLDSAYSLQDVEIVQAVPIAAQLLRRLSVPVADSYLSPTPAASSPSLSDPDSPSPARLGPEPITLPLLKDVAARLIETIPERWERLNRPLPRRFVDAACAAARQLRPVAGTLLANYDLHYENILAGDREPWLAIDPKVVVGDPEYGLAQLLWTRLEEMTRAGGLSYHYDMFIEHAKLDSQRTRAWTIVRCVDYWLWALSVGLTEDPVRCDVITTWLVNGL